MMYKTSSLFIWIAIIGLVAASAVAQESRRGRRGEGREDRGGRTDQEDRGRRNGDRQADPNGGFDQNRSPRDWRGRGGPPREITPEDRERFYDRMVEGQVERLSRNYELDEPQKQQVRAKLEELKVQQRAFSEQHWDEFQSMRQEFWRAREAGTPPDPQRMQEFRQRFETLRTQSPLFNTDRVAGEVEQMLPPDQAERGRTRRQAEEAEREQRREQWRQQWEQRRQNGEDFPTRGPGAPGQPSEGQAPPQAWPQDGQGGDAGAGEDGSRRGWRGRGDGRRRGGDRDGSREGGDGQAGMGGQSVVQPNAAESGGIPENPVGPWEQYVREFVRTYQLDAAQQATASSVLREVLERRVSYEQSHRFEYDKARQLSGSERDNQLAELNRPVVSMFEELKLRLNRIPSSAQRLAAGITTTTRPAVNPGPTTRPARERTGTTRPAGRRG